MANSTIQSPDWLWTDPLPQKAKGWKPRAQGGVKLVHQGWGSPESLYGSGADDEFQGDYGHGTTDKSMPVSAPPTRDDWASERAPVPPLPVPTHDDWQQPVYALGSLGPGPTPTPVNAFDSAQRTLYDGGATSVGEPSSPGAASPPAFRAPVQDQTPRTVAPPAGGGPQSRTGGTTGPPPSGHQQEFVDSLLPYAFPISEQTGIPWQALVAIPANETGWGASVAGNNYYGIKGTGPLATKAATWEEVGGHRVDVVDSFQGYASPADSMKAFAQFIQQNPRYQPALDHLKQNPGDWQGFVTRVHQAGYATDSKWADKVIQIGRGIDAPSNAQGQPAQFQSGSKILDIGLSAVGSKYKWGGAGGRTNFDPNFVGSDCSGFVSWCYYNSTGVQLPAQTDAIYRTTRPLSQSEAKPGDLILFDHGTGPHNEHVAIYAGNGMMLHDSSLNPDGGVELTPVWTDAKAEYRRVPGVDPNQFLTHPGVPAPQAQAQDDHMFDPEGNLWVTDPDGTAHKATPAGVGADAPMPTGVGSGADEIDPGNGGTDGVIREQTSGDQPEFMGMNPHNLIPDVGGWLSEIGKAKDAVGAAIQGPGSDPAAVSAAQRGTQFDKPEVPYTPDPSKVHDILGDPGATIGGMLPEVVDKPGFTPPDPESGLGKAVATGQSMKAADLPQFAGQAAQARESGTEAVNPLRDVPVVGGLINQATDPLTYAPVGKAASVVGRVAGKAVPAFEDAIREAAVAVGRSPVVKIPGVDAAAMATAKAPAQASLQFTADLAGGVAGAKTTADRTDQNDPNYWPKVITGGVAGAAATHAGVHYLVDSGVLPAAVNAWNRIFTPSDLLTADEKALYVGLAHKEESAKVQAELWKTRIKTTLGKRDNLTWAQAHEEFGANNPLLSTPEQHQIASDMIDFTNRTGNIGRAEGFIRGDVAAGPHVPGAPAPAVHFPHVYDQGMQQARQNAAARGGYNPTDTYSFQRTHALLKDAQAAGLTPLDSVSEPYSMYVRRVLSSQGKAEFVAGVKKLPNSQNIVHVGTAGQVPNALAAAGWKSGKDFSAHLQNIAMSPDMYQVMKHLYEPSLARKNRVASSFLNGLGEVKQILLGASGFHGGNLIRQFVGSNGQRGDAGLMGIMFQGATPGGYRDWAMKNMGDIVEAADWGVTMLRSSGNLDSGIRNSAKGTALRTVAGGVLGAASGAEDARQNQKTFEEGLQEAIPRAALGALGAASTRLISDAVFHRYLPMMKTITFQLHKNWAGPEAAAEFVNDAFGGQNIAAMGRSKTVQDILRVIALAPDWQEGWIKQIGNALKPGTLGDLNRQYWANTAVSHAVFLEGMNLALNGHTTADNAKGHELDLELTGLYDRMGWPHVDPGSGQPFRVYAAILGPYKGMLAAPIEGAQALSGQPGHNAGTFGAAAANTLGSRAGIGPGLVGAALAQTDWKGAPVVPDKTDPWQALALHVGQALSRMAPISMQTATQSSKAGPAGAIGAALGVRLSTVSPIQQQYKDRQAIIDQAGRTPAELQTLHEQYSQQLADNDRAAQAVYDGTWKAPGGKVPTHGEMDQQLVNVGKARPKYAEELNSWFPADKLFGGDAAKQSDFIKQIQSYHPGVMGSQVPADLRPESSPDEAYAAYWGVDEAKLQGLNKQQQAAVRGKSLVQWALSHNEDYQSAMDAVKAKTWGGASAPKLPDGVTSETVDNWVTQWGNAPDADGKRKVIDDLAAHYLPGDSHGPDTVWQRIKLRMMPPQQPTVLQISRDHALDVLFASRDPRRFPKYADKDGKALGSPDIWAQFDQQIAQGTTAAGKAKTPEIKALIDARDRAASTRKKWLLDHQNADDYQRWFGLGKTMTEAQWKTYTTTGFPHYKDVAKTDNTETLNRDRVEQLWQAATPAARNVDKVVIQINGQPQRMSLEYAHKHIAATISKGWSKALDIPGQDAVSSGGTNGTQP